MPAPPRRADGRRSLSPADVRAGQNPLRDPRDKRLPRMAGPCALVFFGVTGDLAHQKLLPAVYDLCHRGLLPPGFSVVGFARRNWTDAQFADYVRGAVREHARTPFRDAVWRQLADGMRFVQGSFEEDEAFGRLAATLDDLEATRGTGGNHAFYLSVPPDAFAPVCRLLDTSGLSRARIGEWRRVVVEKPFGHDLASAQEIDGVLAGVFPPDSIFRIDHYLGKETVQNLLALRFANQLFEPIWNAHYIDHVQITMAEEAGIAGRAGYYDGIGAARDVIQNHLLQLLALTAMEEPVSFRPEHLRAEKEKVLAAVRLAGPPGRCTARGQYDAGWQGGERVIGYLREEGIPRSSRTETFAAIKLLVDTRRWHGVPFYVRTGKRLAKRATEIAMVFAKAPNHAFEDTATEDLGHNAIVIRIQPDEGVTIRFGAKIPGMLMQVREVNMDFGYGRAFTEAAPEAYERLILDVLLGDPPLFPGIAEVELSWKILDPVTAAWARDPEVPESYPAGGWGPESAHDLLRRDGREWRMP